MLASKAAVLPIGERRRPISQLSAGKLRAVLVDILLAGINILAVGRRKQSITKDIQIWRRL